MSRIHDEIEMRMGDESWNRKIADKVINKINIKTKTLYIKTVLITTALGAVMLFYSGINILKEFSPENYYTLEVNDILGANSFIQTDVDNFIEIGMN